MELNSSRKTFSFRSSWMGLSNSFTWLSSSQNKTNFPLRLKNKIQFLQQFTMKSSSLQWSLFWTAQEFLIIQLFIGIGLLFAGRSLYFKSTMLTNWNKKDAKRSLNNFPIGLIKHSYSTYRPWCGKLESTIKETY